MLCRYVIATASFAPSIQMSLVIATSVDYSLFLLNSFSEALRAVPTKCHSAFWMPSKRQKIRDLIFPVFLSSSLLLLSLLLLLLYLFLVFPVYLHIVVRTTNLSCGSGLFLTFDTLIHRGRQSKQLPLPHYAPSGQSSLCRVNIKIEKKNKKQLYV
jgi:hypothetical protein